MRLLEFSVVNYKSLKNITICFSKNKPAIFIGVNDCGKSAILKSLQLFFDDKPQVAFETENSKKSNLSNTPLAKDEFDKLLSDKSLPSFNHYESDQICVYCKFEVDEEFDLDVLESNASPQLQLVLCKLKKGDSIHLIRTICADGSKNAYYLLCDDFIENGEPLSLWLRNQKELIKVQAKQNIKDEQIINRNNAGTLKNIERIKALYEKSITQPVWSRFDFRKDKHYFPTFRYFDWNINSSELNELAKDVIEPIIKRSLDPIKQTVKTKAEKINLDANSSLQNLFNKYSDAWPRTIKSLSAHIHIDVEHSVAELFVNKTTSDKEVHIDEQGDGVRRQIWFGLIKAMAEEAVKDKSKTKKIIWCFDEPETHLYPSAQRDLSSTFNNMSNSSFQILISTHSTLFVDRSSLSEINQANLVDGYTEIKTTENTEDIYSSLGVKNSDFLFFDRFMAVEGETEYSLIPHLYKLIYGVSPHEDGIQLINLNGKYSSNCQKLLDDIFKDFRKQENLIIYLLDKDTGKVDKNICLLGESADFEDEIPNNIWIELIKNACGVTINDKVLSDLRAKIDKNDKEKKLYKLLKDFVANNKPINYLPSKGKRLAKEISKLITDKAQVPESIKNAFIKVKEIPININYQEQENVKNDYDKVSAMR